MNQANLSSAVIGKTFSSDCYQLEVLVTEETHHCRLDQFIKLHFPSFSREFIKKKIALNEVTVTPAEGQLKPSRQLLQGQVIQVKCYRQGLEDEFWGGKKIELVERPQIIFQHQSICLINKPPFMTAHPVGRHAFYSATVYLQQLFGKPFASVHRLDRETSGMMALAADPIEQRLLTEQFEQQQVKKIYFFIAQKKNSGQPYTHFWARERLGPKDPDLLNLVATPGMRGQQKIGSELQATMINEGRDLRQSCYPEISTEGKEASTFFHILQQNDNYLCALAFPKTGRQHQIRLHAAYHGLPLIGDKLYFQEDLSLFYRFKDHQQTTADEALMRIPRQALHALALSLKIKADQEFAPTFYAPLPQDLRLLLKDLQLVCPLAEVQEPDALAEILLNSGAGLSI